MTDRFEIKRGFPENQRNTVARLYWQGFGSKLGKLMGPEDRALRFFTPVLDPTYCFTAQTLSGDVMGVAGFKTAAGGFAGGGFGDIKRVYGLFGAVWRAPFLSLLERDLMQDVLLMDGIVVSEYARGTGLGTRLLDAICDEAHRQNLGAVRLDVIDTNPRARALYQRKGFVAIGTESLGPFSWLFGFSSATRMERPV